MAWSILPAQVKFLSHNGLMGSVGIMYVHTALHCAFLDCQAKDDEIRRHQREVDQLMEKAKILRKEDAELRRIKVTWGWGSTFTKLLRTIVAVFSDCWMYVRRIKFKPTVLERDHWIALYRPGKLSKQTVDCARVCTVLYLDLELSCVWCRIEQLNNSAIDLEAEEQRCMAEVVSVQKKRVSAIKKLAELLTVRLFAWSCGKL